MDFSISPAKAILLAVQLAIQADVKTLRQLVAQNRKTFRAEIILRILLTYLPESLDSSEYVPFLLDLASDQIWKESYSVVETSFVEELSDTAANKKVRKLHLLPLIWPNAPTDAPDDNFVLFLIHRAYRIDEETGLITQLPELIVPFLNLSSYLRTWMISTLLPLLRLHYEFYPQESVMQSIKSFEALDDRAGVNMLLSRSGKSAEDDDNSRKTVGRDLRCLVGPWMYGDTRWKRRRTRRNSQWDAQTVTPLDEMVILEKKHSAGWEEVFKWVTSQATFSWITCVEAIEQWDGPEDVDLGGYGDGTAWFQEEERQNLKSRYARAAVASAYLIPEASVEALAGVQRILVRLIVLLDYSRIPTLPAAAALLSPVLFEADNSIVLGKSAASLRTGLMEEQNALTTPSRAAIILLHSLLISAFILTRAGAPCAIRRSGELALLQDAKDQMNEFRKLVGCVSNGPKGDDKYWIRTRNEFLWLRNWGAEELAGKAALPTKGGVLGTVGRDYIEKEVLKLLLANTRYTLARSMYETSSERPLSNQQIQEVVVSAAMSAYDNATNPNRTRGGLKKSDEILQTFPDTLKGCSAAARALSLIKVTHAIGQYRLVLKQGEPFTPIVLRVHRDPISMIDKVLEQNPKSFTRIHDLLDIAEDMVKAGLTFRDMDEDPAMSNSDEGKLINEAQKRVTSMCIDAALSEDDFETAYSYVMNRLNPIAQPAQARTVSKERKSSSHMKTGGIFANPPPAIIDDWSWRAALQAGKYRYNSNTIRPTHLGNSSGNLDIRHLQQRMDCLSMALRIAPPATLQDILNVYRRCEEELDTKIKEEADQEAAWDEQGDQAIMPGGFGAETAPKPSRASTAASRGIEEAPMSIFDLTRASAAQAQRSLSSITALAARDGRAKNPSSTMTSEEVPHGVEPGTVRKRDQLRNAAVGTLASGIGWLINAPPTVERPGEK